MKPLASVVVRGSLSHPLNFDGLRAFQATSMARVRLVSAATLSADETLPTDYLTRLDYIDMATVN